MPHYDDVALAVQDALDRAFTEEDLALRRYRRRYRNESDKYIREAFAKDKTADPDTVALEAVYVATNGQLGTPPALEAGDDATT